MVLVPDTACQEELQKLPRFNQGPIIPLGRGTFGHVFRVNDAHRPGAPLRAVKLIAREAVSLNTVREVLNHYKLRGHAHIITLQDILLTENYLGIIMEYANNGTLLNLIQGAKGKARPPEHRLLRWFQQLVIAVSFFHMKNISNRDIKPDNILVEDLRGNLILKVCDFGYSRDQSYSNAETTNIGTPEYYAPEILTGNHQYDGRAVDVWSCGVVLYIMMYGTYPFGRAPTTAQQWDAMLAKMQNRQYKLFPEPAYTPGCKHLLSRMLDPNPDSRITMEGILQDSWFLQTLDHTHLEYNASRMQKAAGGTPQKIIQLLRDAVPAGSAHWPEISRILQREEQLQNLAAQEACSTGRVVSSVGAAC